MDTNVSQEDNIEMATVEAVCDDTCCPDCGPDCGPDCC
jgi:hypothetical protein